VQLFPLDFENKFYCFFDIGERFFPGLTLADCPGDLNALDRETAFFLGFEHHRVFHRYSLFTKEYTIFPLGPTVDPPFPCWSHELGRGRCRCGKGAVVIPGIAAQEYHVPSAHARLPRPVSSISYILKEIPVRKMFFIKHPMMVPGAGNVR